MSRINRTPEGLQVLLGTQAFGDNPNELSQVVSPTVDLLPFFAASRLRQATLTGSRSTPGEIGRLDLPGKALIVSVGAEITAGVVGPGSIRWAFSFQRVPGPDPSNPCFFAISDKMSVDSNITAAWGYTMPRPVVVLPGTKMTLEVLETSGGLFHSTLTVCYYDLSP